MPQKPQCVVLRQTVTLAKTRELAGPLSPSSFNRHDGAIDPCSRHVAQAGFWMPCRTSPRSVSPDERTSYLSSAAGLHRAKIVGRHCVDSPPRALHRRRIKNISLSPPGKSRAHQLPSCPAKRGVGHRHERGTGSGGRGCAFDERRGSVRRRRVVLTPRCWRQVGGKSRR